MIVSAGDVAQMIVPGPTGVYLVGSGSVGVAQAFFSLVAIYFVVMITAAFAYRVPAPGWRPKNRTQDAGRKSLVTRRHAPIDTALKTPQFYSLWIVLCFKRDRRNRCVARGKDHGD